MSDPSSDVNALDALAEEFTARHRAGERPSLDEFIARRPDLADDIRDLFPGLALMEGVRPGPGDVTGPFEAGAAAPQLKRLGDYRILREVGRGGMGVVYEAEQESLGRHVALKVLPAHSLIEPQRLRRFQRESKAAASLHHTNIVPVYGVGEQEGLHYYVMQFIQGLGLDQVLGELRKLRPAPAVEDAPPPSGAAASAASAAQSMLTGRFETAPPDCESPPVSGGSSAVHLPGQAEGTPPSRGGREYWRSVARVGVQVGDALAYAHGQGVLHRDVKPSNLLLDARGNVWVTDFGLAKAADGEDLTHTGDIVGTLRYMAPECFNGRGDARADVYSLGLTLYELLTLRSAFVGKDRNHLLAQVMHGEPPRPRSLDQDVPRDLETVVLKAIARDPAHRYATAAELVADLQRFLDDRPIRARRVSGLEKTWRWGRRNPLAAGLAAVVLLLLLIGTTGSAIAAYYFSRLADAQAKLRDDADNAKSQIQKQADELRDGNDRMNRASELMESGRLHADAGEYDLALTDYSAAVEQRPDMSAARLTRGQLYMRFYCWNDAAADFERGFALHAPADPGLFLSHAYLRLYADDADGYRRACVAMLGKFGQTTNLDTALTIANACTAGPDAVPDYTRVIRLMDATFPDSVSADLHDLQVALLYARSGKVNQAVRLVEARPHNWNWPDPGIAAAYHRARQDDKARKLMADFQQKRLDPLLDQPFTRSDDTDAERVILDLGEYLRYHETLQLLDGAAAAQHPAEFVLSGLGHAALRQWDKAKADLDRAVSLRPDHAGLRLQRGRVLTQMNRWDEAAADFAQAVSVTPQDGSAIYGEVAGADQRLSAALIALRPDDPWLWGARARQLLAADPPALAEAEVDYAKAIKLRPTEAAFRYDRGRMYAKQGKWEKVAADFDAALKLKEPDGEPGWVDVLMILAAAGDRDVFRRAADRMFALYGGSEDPGELQQTAECCLMLPDACGDPMGCLRAAEKAYADDRGVWRATTLALARYRNGQFEQVVPLVKDRLDNLTNVAEPDRLVLCLLLGMAEHRLGNDDEERKQLKQALQRMDEITSAANGADVPPLPSWHTLPPFAVWQALRGEAAAILMEAAPKPGINGKN